MFFPLTSADGSLKSWVPPGPKTTFRWHRTIALYSHHLYSLPHPVSSSLTSVLLTWEAQNCTASEQVSGGQPCILLLPLIFLSYHVVPSIPPSHSSCQIIFPRAIIAFPSLFSLRPTIGSNLLQVLSYQVGSGTSTYLCFVLVCFFSQSEGWVYCTLAFILWSICPSL